MELQDQLQNTFELSNNIQVTLFGAAWGFYHQLSNLLNKQFLLKNNDLINDCINAGIKRDSTTVYQMPHWSRDIEKELFIHVTGVNMERRSSSFEIYYVMNL